LEEIAKKHKIPLQKFVVKSGDLNNNYYTTMTTTTNNNNNNNDDDDDDESNRSCGHDTANQGNEPEKKYREEKIKL